MLLAVLAATAVAPRGQEAEPPPSDALFAPGVLHQIDLQVHSADWVKLRDNYLENDYYPADLTWNGVTVRNVGIRSRGSGSRSARKPGLRVDFDRYAGGQRFLDLKSLVLDNLTQDHSGIHESVTMAFYARLGIPAPREAFARLVVNGEYVGLYGMVESVDKDLLARVFGVIDDDTQNDGFLFEYDWIGEWFLTWLGDDLQPYKDRFDAKTRESRSDEEKYRPIEQLARIITDTREDRLPAALADILDLPGLMRFIAAQNFVAQGDGFLGTWGVNNFYLYRLEGSPRHVVIAWDEDVAFWGTTFPTNEGHERHLLMNKLMRVPEYRDLYRAELRRAVEMANEQVDGQPWLQAAIEGRLALIDTAMREDPNKPYTNGHFDEAAGRMRAYLPARTAFIACEMERGPRRCDDMTFGGAGVAAAPR